MCSVDAYKREHQSSSCYDGSSGGGCPLPTNSTKEVLELLVATIDFIVCWLKALEHNFLERCNLYTRYMEEFFLKYQLNFLINPVQRKNENRYYMLLEVVGMWKN